MTLYRTHRPRQFSDLVGQDAVRHTLQQALRKQRLGQAYLFTGPRGTGKTSTARIFAKAICCEQPVQTLSDETVSFEACGVCASCLLLAEGRTPDFIELDAASNRGIEDIREIREQAQYPPLQLSRKIYLIDEVHMLTVEAFNALLKTLEEPPAHCLFILATTELHKVPLTIRSRCQLVRFERGTAEGIKEKLERVIKAEGFSVEDGVADLIARHADGGYRDAETVLESLTTQHSPLSLEAAREAMGVLSEESVTALLTAVLEQDATAALSVIRSHIAGGAEPIDRVLTQLLSAVQARLLESSAPSPILAFALQQFLEAFILLRSSPQPIICLEIACLAICDYQKTSSAVDRQGIIPKKDIPAPREHIPNTPPPPVLEAPQPAALRTVDVTPIAPVPVVPVVELRTSSEGPAPDMRKAWKEMADEVCRENLVLGQSIKDTVFHTAENGVLTIRVRFKFHADKMNEKKSKGLIMDALRRLTGRDWEIVYEVSGLAPRRTAAKSLSDGTSDVSAIFGNPPA